MAELRLRGLPYHYRSWGSGPPLLLLHGFSGSSANWETLALALEKERQVIAVDLLGHGASAAPADPARYAMPEAAQDLAALLDALGLAQVDLLGYSMGGRLALYFALHAAPRVRRLVLESASPGLESEEERAARRRADEALAARIEKDGVAAFVDEWERLPLFASQQQLPLEVQRRLREQRLDNRAAGLANSLRGMGTGAQPSLWQALERLAPPLLLLNGELDGKFCATSQRMLQRLPAAQWRVIAGAGHTLHLETPQTFAAEVERFFALP